MMTHGPHALSPVCDHRLAPCAAREHELMREPSLVSRCIWSRRTAFVALLFSIVAALVLAPARPAAAAARAGANCKITGAIATTTSGTLKCSSVYSRGRKVKVWVITNAAPSAPAASQDTGTYVPSGPAPMTAPPTGQCGEPPLESRLGGVPASARIGNLSNWIGSIEAFFSSEMGRSGQRFCPPLRYVANVSTARPACNVDADAYFCIPESTVAWDADEFAPKTVGRFGEPGFGLVLAHEIAHMLQRSITAPPTKTIFKELQADCLAAAWLKSSVDRGQVASSAVPAAIGIGLEFGDEPGTSSLEDPDAHGSAFDRVGALREGYTQGVGRCLAYTTSPPTVIARLFTLTELVSPKEMTISALFDTAMRSLNSLLAGLSNWNAPNRYVNASVAASQCATRLAGATFTDGAASFCWRDSGGRSFVAVDSTKMAYLIVDHHDSAALAVLAYVWLAGALSMGIYDERNYSITIDCWVGAWFNLEERGRKNFTVLPGDLDNVVGGVLSLRTGADPFDRVASLQDGYLHGIEACRKYNPTSTPAPTTAPTPAPAVTTPPQTTSPAPTTTFPASVPPVSSTTTTGCVQARIQTSFTNGSVVIVDGWVHYIPMAYRSPGAVWWYGALVTLCNGSIVLNGTTSVLTNMGLRATCTADSISMISYGGTLLYFNGSGPSRVFTEDQLRASAFSPGQRVVRCGGYIFGVDAQVWVRGTV